MRIISQKHPLTNSVSVDADVGIFAAKLLYKPRQYDRAEIACAAEADVSDKAV